MGHKTTPDASTTRCRRGRHDWQERTNPENGAAYEVCTRCNAYRDDGLPTSTSAGVAGAVQANIGGFGM